MLRLDPGRAVEAAVLDLSHRFAHAFDLVSTFLASVVRATEAGLDFIPVAAAVTILAGLAVATRRFGLAAFAAAAFTLIAAMDLWSATTATLALVLVSAGVAVLVGIPVGIVCAFSRPASVIARPLLDVMQTLPAYVYLIPAVFFFGVGLVPAIVATAFFAIPPAVRMTELGIRQVDAETVEAARAFGAGRWQTLRQVQLPLARPTIMAGINQVIMLSLSMVVICGLVGAEGLGSRVVSAVTQLDIAGGFDSGLAVVLLAIYLDRLTAALAEPRRHRRRPAESHDD